LTGDAIDPSQLIQEFPVTAKEFATGGYPASGDTGIVILGKGTGEFRLGAIQFEDTWSKLQAWNYIRD